MTLEPLKHLAIIMDGNGRWAKKRGLERLKGHQEGVDSLDRVCNACLTKNIPYLTVFGFSTENWSRPQYEVSGIMQILSSALEKKTNEMIDNGIRLNTIGDLNALPASLQKHIQKTKIATQSCTKLTLTLALNYGARTEILSAIKSYIKEDNQDISDLNWENFSKHLSTYPLPDPDIIIRPSGEYRLSNFLLLQAAYSELYFTPTLWPDFGEEDIYEALKWYQDRDRRYGKLTEKVT